MVAFRFTHEKGSFTKLKCSYNVAQQLPLTKQAETVGFLHCACVTSYSCHLCPLVIQGDSVHVQHKKANALIAGALPLLLAMLEDPDPAWYVRGCVRAAGAIRHIAQGTHENRESVIAACVLPVLVQSLDRDREIAAEAAWALCNMASGDQKCKDAVLQAGTVTVRLIFCDSKGAAVYEGTRHTSVHSMHTNKVAWRHK